MLILVVVEATAALFLLVWVIATVLQVQREHRIAQMGANQARNEIIARLDALGGPRASESRGRSR